MTASTKMAIGLGVLCAFLLGIVIGYLGHGVKETSRQSSPEIVAANNALLRSATDSYATSVEESEIKTCRANMQSIANAAQAWKVKNRASDFLKLTFHDLTPDLGVVPTCPNGGTYSLLTTGTVKDSAGAETTIPNGSLGISCSNPGHNGFIPGVMSQ